MSQYQVQQTLLAENTNALANAVELGSRAIIEIAGEDIADTLRGQPIDLVTLQHTLAARLRAAIVRKIGG